MSITSLFDVMSSLFAAMAVGFLGVKLRIIDQNFNKKLSGLLLTLIHPCMILSSVLGKERVMTGGQLAVLFAVAAGYYLIMIPVSTLFVRILHAPREDWGTYRFLLMFSNVGFMGYPVAQALLGPEADFHVTIFVLMFQFFSYSYGIHLMSNGERFRLDLSLFRRPLVWAAIAALFLYLTHLQPPELLSGMVQYVGKVSTPLSMVIIGCSLAEVPWRAILGNYRIYVLSFTKLVLVPILGFLLLRLFLKNSLLLGTAAVMLTMPAGTTAATLALAYGGNQKLASSSIFLSTIISLFSIPAILWLLFLK